MRNAVLLLLLSLTGQGQAPPSTDDPPAASVALAPAELAPEALVGAWRGQWTVDGRAAAPLEVVFSAGIRPRTVLAHVTFARESSLVTLRREARLTDGRVRLPLGGDGEMVLRLADDTRLLGDYVDERHPAGVRGTVELSRLRR